MNSLENGCSESTAYIIGYLLLLYIGSWIGTAVLLSFSNNMTLFGY